MTYRRWARPAGVLSVVLLLVADVILSVFMLKRDGAPAGDVTAKRVVARTTTASHPSAVPARSAERRPAPTTTRAASSPASSPTASSPRPPTSASGRSAPPTSRSMGSGGAPIAGGADALNSLAALDVQATYDAGGFDPGAFGPAVVPELTTCGSANAVLRRDLSRAIIDPGGCVVRAGVLTDPYTGTSVTFRPGAGSGIALDHVVSLRDAWESGASRWTAAERAAFARDSLNLLAVSSGTETSRAGRSSTDWLPPAQGYRCAYVARQIAVKTKYHLTVTGAESAADFRVLLRCGLQTLPAR
ncbi:MAG: HNH endonuclease family protein [Mycobacteriales bacterium]